MTISTTKGNFDLAQIEENRMAIKLLQHKFNVFVEEFNQKVDALENNLKTKVNVNDFTKFEEDINKLINDLKNDLENKASQSDVTSQGNKITTLENLGISNTLNNIITRLSAIESRVADLEA